ncbi:MAG: hypothetical protein ABFR33_03910 [Verrucomicrobiota bacterium]
MPVIGIQTYLSETGWAQTPTNDSWNIEIPGNTFINIDGPAVQATSASGVQIIDNTVDTDLGIKVITPPNTTAEVFAPNIGGEYEKHEVGSGRHAFRR